MKLCLILLYVILIYVIYKIFITFNPFKKNIIEGISQINGETNRNKHFAPDLNKPHIVNNENECANSSVLLRYGNKKLCIPNNGIYHTNRSGCNGINITLENSISGCHNSFKMPSTKMLAFTGKSDKCGIIENPIQWHESNSTSINTEKYLGDKNSNCSSFRITDNDPNKTSEEDKWKYKSCVTEKMYNNDNIMSFKDYCNNPEEKYSWMYKFWPWLKINTHYINSGNGGNRNTPEKCKILCASNKSCSGWHYHNGNGYNGCYLFTGKLPEQQTKMNNGKYSNNQEIFVGKDYHSGYETSKEGQGYFFTWNKIKSNVIVMGSAPGSWKGCKSSCANEKYCGGWEWDNNARQCYHVYNKNPSLVKTNNNSQYAGVFPLSSKSCDRRRCPSISKSQSRSEQSRTCQGKTDYGKLYPCCKLEVNWWRNKCVHRGEIF